jgi:hypothetical protein
MDKTEVKLANIKCHKNQFIDSRIEKQMNRRAMQIDALFQLSLQTRQKVIQ